MRLYNYDSTRTYWHLKDYPRDAKIDVDLMPYTLYSYNDDSTDVKRLTTNYDKDKNIKLWV
jgi:hypothetical protein